MPDSSQCSEVHKVSNLHRGEEGSADVGHIFQVLPHLFVKAALIQNGVRIRIAEWDWKRHGHNCDRIFMKVE